ncbi:carbonic anhydrase [Variovorax ginsengisoli]|uniref:Carbonic anhydrase n=1 Tax=Variovorax ginsengisoli TaxID=363844 RepID=A0ABT8SIK9_9BURK|nr:carbonic anhydrase [Variovorax ginsengisoli]MDN8618677.1 carbonic anhydrase [Variovorax ginsengisoli]MDO1537847.1 carbonic anhydrase [Variovorax ginsengisoli]
MFPKRLSDGYEAFLSGRFPDERIRYEQLAEIGQNPEILLIGCCDSRVSPEVIFDAGPGEMFVIRNVANLVPPYEGEAESSSYHGTSAAIEFAVNALNVKHIVVLGHASCGGVRAVFDDFKPLTKIDFVGKWVSQIIPVADSLPRTGDRAHDIQRLERAVVGHSLTNLMTFPSIRARVEDGRLELHGAYFGVATGLLFLRDPASGEFSPVRSA